MEKNDGKTKKMKKWIQTQNPLLFPRFTVVVVTFFNEILDDFHDFVSECVTFQMKINNPFWVSAFFRRKVTIFIGRETKTHILQTKINEKKSPRSADLTIIVLLEYCNHYSTTTTIKKKNEKMKKKNDANKKRRGLVASTAPT